ncbi:MAG: signal peptidase I [Solirubrobacteraceae bacterium]|nr:signal peptidase I [Solirubrobacteraceae bacterium]
MSSATATPGAVLSAPRSVSPVGRIGTFLSGVLLLVALMVLVAVVVAGANGLRVRVEQTGSMAPALQPGDLVIVKQVAVDSVALGDVIGVRTAAGQVIVHRVQRVDGAGGALRVTTRGDANPTSETWTIPRGSEVALVRGSIPSLGSMVDAVKGPFAAFAVLIAGLLLALSQLRSIWSRPA